MANFVLYPHNASSGLEREMIRDHSFLRQIFPDSARHFAKFHGSPQPLNSTINQSINQSIKNLEWIVQSTAVTVQRKLKIRKRKRKQICLQF